uniref:Uncharacterized protein n=1 Tax=Plectus sambesii TaxID=2011161 RepID=A0A914W6X0_9BILA
MTGGQRKAPLTIDSAHTLTATREEAALYVRCAGHKEQSEYPAKQETILGSADKSRPVNKSSSGPRATSALGGSSRIIAKRHRRQESAKKELTDWRSGMLGQPGRPTARHERRLI